MEWNLLQWIKYPSPESLKLYDIKAYELFD